MVNSLKMDGKAAAKSKRIKVGSSYWRVVVGPMVDVYDVGDHRPLGDKSPLVFVDVWPCDCFPSDSASSRQESVVCVGYGKWACVVAAVDVCPILGGVAGVFGEADQDGVVEFVVFLTGLRVVVDSLHSFPRMLRPYPSVFFQAE